MGQYEFLGMLVSSLVILIGLIITIVKCLKPISELNVSIIRLNETIKNLIENDKKQDHRIEKHGQQLDMLILQNENHEQRIKVLERKE